MSYRNGKLVSAFAVAALTLAVAGPAYPLTSFKSNIINTVWLCTQPDPTKGTLLVHPTMGGAMEQSFSDVTCILFDDSGSVDMGHGVFQFVLSLTSSVVTPFESGKCTLQYSGSCPDNLWSGYAQQTGGDNFAECANLPGGLCHFSTSDPTANAKNASQVDTLCSAAFPMTTDYLGNSWDDHETTFYQTTDSGATCGTDLLARYCFSLPGVECVSKVKGKYFAHVSSATSTDFILTDVAMKDPFNPDSGTFQVDFLESGIQITGFDTCDPATAPKIGGVVPIRSGGCTQTDADHNGVADNPRFFYSSSAVYAWILQHGGVKANGSADLSVTGTTTDGRHLIGLYQTHINNP